MLMFDGRGKTSGRNGGYLSPRPIHKIYDGFTASSLVVCVSRHSLDTGLGVQKILGISANRENLRSHYRLPK
jgi:hypothetical protein